MSDDELLGRLADERAIYRVFFNYFWLVDHDGWHRVAEEVFAPDAVIVFGGPAGTEQTVAGREAIHAFYEAHHGSDADDAFDRMAHVAGQWIIDWDGDRPTVRSYATGWRWLNRSVAAGERRPADVAVVGLSEDEYVRVDGAWLIGRRTLSYYGTAVEPGPVPAARA